MKDAMLVKMTIEKEIKNQEATVNRLEEQLKVLHNNIEMLKMARDAITEVKPIMMGTEEIKDITPVWKAGMPSMNLKLDKYKKPVETINGHIVKKAEQPIFTRKTPCIIRMNEQGLETGRWLSQRKAAEELGITQSNVSYILRKMSKDRQIQKYGCYIQWQH